MSFGLDGKTIFLELSFKFREASTGKKFLEKVSAHLEAQYGVQLTNTGKKAVLSTFRVASEVIQTPDVEITLADIVVQKLVENWSRPVRTLH